MKLFYWISAAIFVLVLVFFVFAPAFAGKLVIPPQLNFGKFAIRLYGLTLAGGILVGYIIARQYSWRFGISKNEIDDIAFWITIVGLLGARLYYVIFNWSLFSFDYLEIYKIWHGGLSIYGSLSAGLIFVLLYARKKAYTFYQLLDLIALALPLAQALGRFGNFFNQEAYGLPTNLPWKMYVSLINRPPQYRNVDFFHPTFLYEAIWNLVIFFVLTKVFLGKVKPGALAFIYLGMYSFGRFFIEAIRLDSSYIVGFKVDQVTAVVGLLLAGVMVWRLQRKGQLSSN